MRLVFDSETSGLRKEGLPSGDPSQPRIAQLAASLYSMKWERLGRMSVLIRPDGWAFEAKASQVNGLTDAQCQKYGVPIVAALAIFQGMSECALQLIGHNIEYDREMITNELRLLGADANWWSKKASCFTCTQELSTPLCQLPGKFGFKYPSLEELYRFLFPEKHFRERGTAHRADEDVDRTAECAQELERRGIIKPPRRVTFNVDWSTD